MCTRHPCDRAARLKRFLHDLPTFQFRTMSLFLTCISIRFHQSSQSDLSAPCKNDGSRPGGLDGLHKTLTHQLQRQSRITVTASGLCYTLAGREGASCTNSDCSLL